MNKKNLILAIGFLVLLGAAGSFFALWRFEVKSHGVTKESLKTAEGVIKTHEGNIAISERANHDYQSNITRLNADIKRLRNRPSRCVPITRPSGLHPGQGSGGEHGGEDGIRSDWLEDYSIDCEKLRIERNGCKGFTNEIYDSRPQ